MTTDPAQLDSQGKRAFAERKYAEAAQLFRRAAEGYAFERAALLAAEMKNNMSAALLKAGRPQEALDAALGTDEVFAGANDPKRRAMALGNQAAALEELKRYDEALQKYELAADLLGQVHEGDLRAVVMKSAAAVKLKTGRVGESAFKMMGSLDAKKNPNLFERILKFLLDFVK